MRYFFISPKVINFVPRKSRLIYRKNKKIDDICRKNEIDDIYRKNEIDGIYRKNEIDDIYQKNKK